MTVSEWGPFSLADRTVVVTGAARGIGLGCARRFREAGAHVVVADLNRDGADRAVEALLATPGDGRVVAVQIDVTDPDSIAAMVERCATELGSIDVLVNNAGIYPAATFVDMTPEHVRQILQVNVEGLILTTRAVALYMIERGVRGAVVNLASMGARRGTHPGLIAYGASKGAVESFTIRAAGALAADGIRVNAIAPGTIETEGGAALLGAAGLTDEAMAAAVAAANSQIPLGRPGTPDDIATVAVFLASDAARYITGVTLMVDGGRMLA